MDTPSLADFDRPYYKVGPKIIGVDEAGRGPLAGPVVASACYLPFGFFLEGIRDSKQLPPKKRALIFQHLQHHPDVLYGLGIASVEEIDELNIYRATQLAMMRAIAAIGFTPDLILVDAMPLPLATSPVQSIIRGDAQSQLIAAASICAKETRDAQMQEFDRLYPHYGFARHMGYPTAQHIKALKELGPTPIHRRSYRPVKELISLQLAHKQTQK